MHCNQTRNVQPKFYASLTGLEKHGCHAMIWSWLCHDDGKPARFVHVVAMIHGIIIIWLPYFPWLIPWSWYEHHIFNVICKIRILCFPNSCCHLQLYGTFDWSEEIWRPACWDSKIERKLLQKGIEYFSVITIQQVIIYQYFENNISITHLLVIFNNFEFLGKRSILVNVFWVIFDGLVQHIPC